MQVLRQYGLSLHDFDSMDRIGVFLRFLKAGSYQQQILLMDDEQRNKLKIAIEKYKSIHIELFKSKYDVIILESRPSDDVFLKMRSFLWTQSRKVAKKAGCMRSLGCFIESRRHIRLLWKNLQVSTRSFVVL